MLLNHLNNRTEPCPYLLVDEVSGVNAFFSSLEFVTGILSVVLTDPKRDCCTLVPVESEVFSATFSGLSSLSETKNTSC